TKAQRIALALRDGGCTAEGCDRPAGWCHAHHDIPFSQGGPTNLEHGRLLCARHHTLIHHRDYQATLVGNN
ncbi:HNH endonuclease signature motif containing protein, partial [Escherichia coli]